MVMVCVFGQSQPRPPVVYACRAGQKGKSILTGVSHDEIIESTNNSLGDYAFTGYNLRAGAELLLQGVLGALDLSGLTDTGAISVDVWPGKTGSLSGFTPNGSSTTMALGGSGSLGMVRPVVGGMVQ